MLAFKRKPPKFEWYLENCCFPFLHFFWGTPTGWLPEGRWKWPDSREMCVSVNLIKGTRESGPKSPPSSKLMALLFLTKDKWFGFWTSNWKFNMLSLWHHKMRRQCAQRYRFHRREALHIPHIYLNSLLKNFGLADACLPFSFNSSGPFVLAGCKGQPLMATVQHVAGGRIAKRTVSMDFALLRRWRQTKAPLISCGHNSLLLCYSEYWLTSRIHFYRISQVSEHVSNLNGVLLRLFLWDEWWI